MPPTSILVVLVVGSVFAVVFLALLAYRATITRYEEDQLFLSEESDSIEHSEQNEIFRKVKTLSPLIRISGIGAILMIVIIIAYYVWSAVGTILK